LIGESNDHPIVARVRGKRATTKQYVKTQALFHGQPTELLVGLICNKGLAPTEASYLESPPAHDWSGLAPSRYAV